MATITIPVNGTDVTMNVARNTEHNTVTVTFMAPPGAGGPAQSQPFSSISEICSKQAENGCTYCMRPKPGLSWGQVVSAADLKWEVSCTA
ncbi:MAG: hypothetical protein COA70_12805 [Planctomycetota bacterium]|nr:MAG: hypothetical protein COA70_12805 [Planctomycetota bacterium]